MKMKKLLALMLAAVMALSLAACGDSGSKESAAPSQSSGSPSSEAPSQGGGEGGEVLIGCLQDITGPTSALGMSVQAGAQAAVDEINANGGIDGKTVVMKTYDTKGDVTEAVNAYITAVWTPSAGTGTTHPLLLRSCPCPSLPETPAPIPVPSAHPFFLSFYRPISK